MIGVFGIGSTLRRDDGIGIALLHILEENFGLNTSFSFRDYGTGTLEMIGAIEDFSSVLIIDAIDAGIDPGKLLIFRLEEAAGVSGAGAVSSHELSLAHLFRLYSGLGLKVPVFIAGIQWKDISYGEGLSPALEIVKEGLSAEISSFLRKMSAGDPL